MKYSVCFAFALFFGTLILPPSALATESSADRNANKTASNLREKGFSIRKTYRYGFLAHGGSTYFTTTLYSGNTYGLVVGGCNDAYDVDVLIYDEDWNFIAKDTSTKFWGVVTVTPRWTGRYYVKVRMYKSIGSGAHWTLLFAYL